MSNQSDSKKWVMVVDNEPDICTVMKRFLDGNGFTISTFTNPSLALDHFKLEPEKYQFLITDIRMPEMNGFELTRKINSVNPRTKIILMTAFEIEKSEFRKVMPHSVIEAFLRKPVSRQQLLEVLENLSVPHMT